MHLKLVPNNSAPASKHSPPQGSPATSLQSAPTSEADAGTAPVNCSAQETSRPPVPSKAVDKSELESRRFWRDFKDRTQHVDLDINYEDISRYHDEANGPSSDDLISLGKLAEVQVRAVFERYGFPLPTTWAELRANHLFVQRIERARQALLPYAPRHFEAGLHLLRSVYPTVRSEVIAYLRDDLEGLKRHLREKGAFKRNARAYDESGELGWVRRER